MTGLSDIIKEIEPPNSPTTVTQGESYCDPSIVTDNSLTVEELALRSRAAWQAKIDLEKEQGSRVVMPDPYRSIALDMFGHGNIMDDVHKIIVEESFEKILVETCASAEAVAASRIAQLKNIADLSTGYSSLVNAILAMGQELSIVVKCTKYAENSLSASSYERQVKIGDEVSVNDLRHIAALIVAKAKTGVEHTDSLNRRIIEQARQIDDLKKLIETKNQQIYEYKVAPQPMAITGLNYVIARFEKNKENELVTRYAKKEETGAWTTTNLLVKAARFSSRDKAQKLLKWLSDNPSEHAVSKYSDLNILQICLNK